MEDKSIFTNNQPQTISEGLQNFIDSMVEEIVLEGRAFDTQKKWLRKYAENEGINYEELEKNLNEFFETMEELKRIDSKSSKRLAGMLAKDCFLSEDTADKLITVVGDDRSKEEARIVKKVVAGIIYALANKAESKAHEEAARKAREEAERKAREEAERKAKEEAKRKAEEKARREAEEAERQRQQRIAEEKRKEEEKRRAEREAEQALWKQCLASHTKESIQQYLNRYPSGIFAARAYDEMIQIEKEEQRQKEEDRQKAEDKAKREAEEAERQRQYRIAEEKRKEEGNLSNNKNSMEETPNMKLAIWCLIVCVALILISYFFFWDSYLGGLFRLCAFILCGLFTWASTRKPFCTFLVGSIAYAILIFVMLTDKGQCGWGLLIGCGIALFIALKKMVD